MCSVRAHWWAPAAGARLLRERPGLRVRAAELLAALKGGLPVHKAWLRASGCAVHGSQRCDTGL